MVMLAVEIKAKTYRQWRKATGLREMGGHCTVFMRQ